MIPHQYITEETLLLLAECGCEGLISGNTQTYITQEQAMRWLREKGIRFCALDGRYTYSFNVLLIDDIETYKTILDWYNTHEEAAEEAIKQACGFLLKK